jgi:hypothetical protein
MSKVIMFANLDENRTSMQEWLNNHGIGKTKINQIEPFGIASCRLPNAKIFTLSPRLLIIKSQT